MGGDVESGRTGLTEGIIRCIIAVHRTLGPGFLETVYRRALVLELRKQGLTATVEKEIVIYYDGQEVGRHRLDLLVEGRVIVEVKTVENLGRAHYAQVRSYLAATGLRLALLINFAGERADFRRVQRIHNPLSPHHQASPHHPE
jgi:GxxExxY protein